MKTRDMVYYVGQVEDENETPDPDSGVGAVAGQAWASVTRSALMPGCVTPTTSVCPSSNNGESTSLYFVAQFPTSADCRNLAVILNSGH